MKQQKKGRSVQELIGIKTFTKYGLMTGRGELLFFRVAPTNISVLSHANIEVKIRRLMMVLSALPDIEIVCTDSSECFVDNKAYLTARLEAEDNGRVKRLIKKGYRLSRHHSGRNGCRPSVFLCCTTERTERKAGI